MKLILVSPVTVPVLILGSLHGTLAGTPAPARYYKDQMVDHDSCCDNRRWAQRYYTWGKEFQGPGHPIFCILGGEGNIEPSTGLVYPFITHHLAKDFGAYVIQPEHRFYGESQPLKSTTDRTDLAQLLTPQQALQDAMRLIRHYQLRLNCSLKRTSPLYCPAITVGGSYSGWLSAMARLRFPDLVDMAYAASAPMLFYSQQISTSNNNDNSAYAYYNHITAVADQTRLDCAQHVKTTLSMVQYILLSELPDNDYRIVEDMVVAFGFCRGSQPNYIRTLNILAEELFMIIGYTFANDNMANYPPIIMMTTTTSAATNSIHANKTTTTNTNTSLYQSCETFASIHHTDPIETVSRFIKQHFASNYDNDDDDLDDCVNMSLQSPTGPNATLSGGDWSGVGTGLSGERWDFQTCTLLVEAIGFSSTSMFPEREWSMDWLVQHCQTRFQVTPEPRKLVDEWHFDDLVGSTNASHIIFTNGLNDGWSVGGILQNLSDTLLSINFENGAHHSDLSHVGPSDQDTPDIVAGFVTIRNILTTWLNEIQPDKYSQEPLSDLEASVVS